MSQDYVADVPYILRPVWGNHLFKIGEKAFVDWQQIIHVPEEGFRLICGDYGGVLGTSKGA